MPGPTSSPFGSATPEAAASQATAIAARIRLRRALTLLGMTVVAPGSAQLVAGNRRVGRIALRVWFGLILAALVFAALALWGRSGLVTMATSLWMLSVVRFVLIALALGWAYLIIDAWRIADPLGLARRQRLALTAVNGLLCFSLAGALLFASHLVAVQRDFIAAVFAADEVTDAHDGRYNVLLLGGDAGAGRVGIRPDSLTVASIDEETGRTVLFGLPRNMAKVPFPEDSPMRDEFPDGFDCDGCYLNAINTYVTDHPDLYPDEKHPGIDATVEAVEEITGLPINYYALIDLRGFSSLVDAVGGVTIDVQERIPMFALGNDNGKWIEPGEQHLDGVETLWYARSRATSDDYGRMARQKCVMNAMLQQLDPQTVLTNFGDIAKAGKQILSTTIPAGEVDTFVNLAMKTRNLPVASVSFVPPKVNTSDPDFDEIHEMVTAAVEKAESLDSDDTKGGNKKAKKKADANHSKDIAASC